MVLIGFEIEEEPSEEIPYSFKDYVLQPLRFSSEVFKGMSINPKLKYWLTILLISSAFVAIGNYSMLRNLNIEVSVGGNVPEETATIIRGMMELFIKNPIILFLESFISGLILQAVIALVLFILVKLFGSSGRYSSSIMIMGLSNVPSIVYGLLLFGLGLIMPPLTWTISISPQQASFGGAGLPIEVISQQSILSILISIWTLGIIYSACRQGFEMNRSRSLITALITWLIVIAPSLYQIISLL